MSFFGLTYFGPETTFQHLLVSNSNINDHQDSEFQQAFTKIDKDNKGYITKNDLRNLMNLVYGEAAPEIEVRLLMQMFKDDDSEITIKDLMLAVEMTKEKRKQTNNCASEYKSNQLLRQHHHHHQRLEYNPQDRYRTPVTSAQQIGWYGPSGVEKIERRPNKSCDETKFACEMIKSRLYF